MATVTGFTADRLLEMEAATIVDGTIVGDNLILTRQDASTIDAGNVRGPAGTPGEQGETGVGIFPGQIVLHGLTTPPPNWLPCDGTDYLIADYVVLAAALGTTYNTMAGAADPGAGRFRVPNLKGRVPVGADPAQTEFDVRGETGGAKTHTLLTAEMPAHTHTQNSHNHTQDSHNHTQNQHRHNFTNNTKTFGDTVISLVSGGSGVTVIQGSNTETAYETATNQAATATNQAATATNQNTGGGGAHNNLQPYAVLNYAIYAGT